MTESTHEPDDQPLSPLDTFLFRGDEHARTRSSVTALCLFESPLDRQRVLEQFERASRLVPRLRQKVVAPPLPVFLPSWVVDPDFDLSYHVRFRRIGPKGTFAELLDLVQSDVVSRLDPSRPLWEAQVVDGWEGGGAMLLKLGHAIADGLGAVKLLAALWTTEPDADPGPMPPKPIPRDVTPNELLRERLRRSPVELGRWTADAATTLIGGALGGGGPAAAGEPAGGGRGSKRRGRTAGVELVRQAEEYLASVQRMYGAAPPSSPLLRRRSLQRRVLAFDLPLDQVKRAGKSVGGSVNDVYLAGVVGALHHYHEALGVPVDALPLAMPVDLRALGDKAAGNFWGAVLLAAPVGLADPRERIRAVREAVLAARAEPSIGLMGMLTPVVSRLPSWLLEPIAEATPAPDIQASNVPGSPVPLYFAGSRAQGLYGFGPVPGTAGMFTLQSYAGTCQVGLNFDPAAFTEPGLLADCLAAGFTEVLKLGGRTRLRRPTLGPEPAARPA